MTTKLSEYQRKRNFEKTAEPEGGERRSGEELRFVVQHHLARKDHYDVRLEWDGALLSWAVPKGPSFRTQDKRLAVQVEDHPLDYRNFEGTIPKGEYGGGVVMLWDEGFWEPHGDVNEGLKVGMLKFTLKGRRLKGKWALVRLSAKEGETKQNWLLLKEKDAYAQETDGISGFQTSIRTGRSMEEITRGEAEQLPQNPFHQLDVQLAKLVDRIPPGDEWLYEMKFDGYRILAFLEGNRVRLITRNGNDYTSRFQDVSASLLDWAGGRAMVLDGEMTIIDERGKTDFQALQNYLKHPKGKLTYILFDLLALDGVDLREEPLLARKERLETLMQQAPSDLFYSRHVRGKGEESFQAACAAGMEGIVGKKADSPYTGTRNGDWIKRKCEKRQEFVIGGYTRTDKKTSGVSALLLGVYEGEDLIYAGRAGTGLSESDMKLLEDQFAPLCRERSPFALVPKERAKEEITWVRPELVAEIKFAEWTKDGLLRHASFQGLRADKNPREVKAEHPDRIELEIEQEAERSMEEKGRTILVAGVRISSPDKVMYEEPKRSKEDVVRYYEQISERMLPYVSQRILSVVRCPKGIAGTHFFKKHPGLEQGKGIRTLPIPNSDGETEEYCYLEKLEGLLFEAQMSTVEFHIWGSQVKQLEQPDMMVFDLDPDEGMEMGTIRQGVLDMKQILAELSLHSYLKTSGGKGYHVVVPLKPLASWETVHDFSKRVAEVMEQTWPDRYTSNVRKAKRSDKIFIDWIRNGRGATSVAPYSLRARPGAKVSMPIAWEELSRITPDGITMEDALLRMKEPDPWQNFFQVEQMLKA